MKEIEVNESVKWGVVGTVIGRKLERNMRMFRVHTTSRTASIVALYSASIDERDMLRCFRDFQDIGAPATVSRNPVIDLRSSRSWAQSESEYERSPVPSRRNTMPISGVPDK